MPSTLTIRSTADALISRGYRVRGVTRDVTRAQPLKEKLDTMYGEGMMEVVEVVDASLPDAYAQVLQGAPYLALPSMDSQKANAY
jgi:uncharacterized protein YbjT (DUF2867 family)